MPHSFDLMLNRAGAAASVIFGLVGMLPVVRGSGWSSPLMTTMTLPDRLNVLLHLSIATAVCHGVCWVLAERVFDWHYGVGPRTPKGWSAVILSFSLTLPAVIVPVLYQAFTGTMIVPSRHAYGAIFVLVGGASAYVILFGTGRRSFPGVRTSVLRSLRARPLRGEVVATAAYAAILIPLIAVPYRLLVYQATLSSQSQPTLFLGSPCLASAFAFGCITACVLVVQPSAKLLKDTVWIHVRGLVAGMITVLATCVALYT